MKKSMNFFFTPMLAVLLVSLFNSSFGQSSSDTVKTGKTNDPMVVNPGKADDSIAVNPGKANDPMAAMTDTGFINRNIMDNITEIQLSKLGRDKGTSAAVKKVASQMITDHTAILSDLKRLAARNGSSFKNGHDMAGVPPAELAEGSDFDSRWASAMLTMHEAKIDELEKFMAATHNAAIKAAIGRALPKIRAHKAMLAKIPGVKVTQDPNSVVQ